MRVNAVYEPDPVLTANVYYAGRLDSLVLNIVGPFFAEFRSHIPNPQYYVWLLRYNRCGEHLKIRIHAPFEEISLLSDLLGSIANDYLARKSLTFSASSVRRRDAPPIDLEDYESSDHPDRTLVWTHYRRSAVSLGPKPFLVDDTYVALFTKALGMGCEFFVQQTERFLETPAESFPGRFCQSSLLKLILSGLSVLDFTWDEKCTYACYHRDWLLRSLLVQNKASSSGEQRLLELLADRTQRLGEDLQILNAITEKRWSKCVLESDVALAKWQEGVADLSQYIEGYGENADYYLDPFAVHHQFPVIFKLLHGVANQLGVKKLDEALAYHLILASLEHPATHTRHVRKTPFDSSERA